MLRCEEKGLRSDVIILSHLQCLLFWVISLDRANFWDALWFYQHLSYMLLEIFWQWLIWLQAGLALSEKKFPWNMVQLLSVVPSDVLAFPWMCATSALLFHCCKAIVSPQCMLSFSHTAGCSWSSICLWKVCSWFQCAMNPSCLCWLDSKQHVFILHVTNHVMLQPRALHVNLMEDME